MRGKRGIVDIPYFDRETGEFSASYDQEAMIYGPVCVTQDHSTGKQTITHVATGRCIYASPSRKAMLRAAAMLADDPIVGPTLAARTALADFTNDADWPTHALRIKTIIGGALYATREVREG